jgi:Protein phosphatase 2C
MTLSGDSPPDALGFVVVTGGVTGREHRRAHRDGQDGHATVAGPGIAAVVVTDGCSSGTSSEVGARLGARWLAGLILRIFPQRDPTAAAQEVTASLVERLRQTARSLSADASSTDPQVVADHLLFGFLAAVVTDEHAIVFGVGDGIAWVDGRTTVLDPGPDNAPTYAAYALLGATIAPQVLHRSASTDAHVLAIATDGAEELLAPSSDPSFEAIVRDERFCRNPSLLRKRLVVLSDRGAFRDDTTIGIVRRP